MGKENRQRLAAPYMVGMSSNLVFGPPSTPKGCERGDINVGKVLSRDTDALCGDLTKYEHAKSEDIPPGEWWVSEKKVLKDGALVMTYCYHGGFVSEYYDKDGHLLEQDFLDENLEQAKSTKGWFHKSWSANGDLLSREKGFPEKNLSEEDRQVILDAIKENGQDFPLWESFHPNGARDRIEYCRIREGEMYLLLESWNEEHKLEGYFLADLEGRYCSPENTPTCCRCFEGGSVELDCGGVRGGVSVLHRTNGPALYRCDAWGEYGRYFLEGKEYSKAEWEKKVGRA